VTYEALHSYLIEGLRYGYDLYAPSEERGLADSDVDEAAAPQAVEAREGDVVRVDPLPPTTTFNMVFQSAAENEAAIAAAAEAASAAPAALYTSL
jgi:hypothetical protein